MRYAVTGGAGFIGSAIVKKLLDQPYNEVVVCDIGGSRPVYLDELQLDPKRVDLCVADVRDRSALEACFRGVHGVFHCAAYSKILDCIKNPDLAIDVNVKGTLNVLYAAKLNKVKRVVYSASASVYGEMDYPGRITEYDYDRLRPMNIYGSTKYFGEVLCRQFSQSAPFKEFQTVSLRYFNVFGSELADAGKAPFPSVVERFLYARIHNQPLTITGDGKQRRDFVSVEDVVAANLRAMNDNGVLSGDVYNIGSGVDYSISEIAGLIGGPTVSVNPTYPEPTIMSGSIKRAIQYLGFEPTPNSLRDFILKMKQKYNLA